MLTQHYRGEIHKVWGDTRKVAESAYGAWTPYHISAHFLDAGEESSSSLSDYYPDHKCAMDMAFMAIELKDAGPHVFCLKLDDKMQEVLKEAVFDDDGGD
jgi:hypothetical protein